MIEPTLVGDKHGFYSVLSTRPKVRYLLIVGKSYILNEGSIAHW